jgi:hypothetical protein
MRSIWRKPSIARASPAPSRIGNVGDEPAEVVTTAGSGSRSSSIRSTRRGSRPPASTTARRVHTRPDGSYSDAAPSAPGARLPPWVQATSGAAAANTPSRDTLMTCSASPAWNVLAHARIQAWLSIGSFMSRAARSHAGASFERVTTPDDLDLGTFGAAHRCPRRPVVGVLAATYPAEARKVTVMPFSAMYPSSA